MNELNNSKARMKSLNDVMEQKNRIMTIRYKGADRWLKVAIKIADFYSFNIVRQFELENEFKTFAHIKRSHAVRSYMQDTSLDIIRNLKPWKKHGLYAYDDHGNKITPYSLYFGIDTRLFRKDGVACGRCYFHYLNALRPVFLPDGTHYREPQLSNVSCSYKNGVICDFYRE